MIHQRRLVVLATGLRAWLEPVGALLLRDRHHTFMHTLEIIALVVFILAVGLPLVIYCVVFIIALIVALFD